jgi:hypothetical protein
LAHCLLFADISEKIYLFPVTSLAALHFFNPFFCFTHLYIIEKCSFFNSFPADVANKQHQGSAPKSHFCDLTGKTEMIGLSGLRTLFIDLG